MEPAKSPSSTEFVHNNWKFVHKLSHILPSKCTPPCSPNELCSVCLFNQELNLPHLPEMVYPNNYLKVIHSSGAFVEFTALEALKLVKQSENVGVKIACAEEWKRSRQDTGLVDNVIGNFDWTFNTDYSGTWGQWSACEPTQMTIDLEKLKVREEILLYQNITLFEDELHDNGTAVATVRIRVMPSGFFILLRYFLRVDGVIIRVQDTRIYHDFSTDFLICEITRREGRVSQLRLPLQVMTEPDEVTPLLPLVESKRLKYVLATPT